MIVLSHEQNKEPLQKRSSTITTSISSIVKQEEQDFAKVSQVIAENEYRIADFNALYPRLIRIAKNLQTVNKILLNVEKEMYSMKRRDTLFQEYSIGWQK